MRDGRATELAADSGRPAAWTLLAGGYPQSHVDLDDPRHLEFEYVRRLGHVIDLGWPASQPLRVLHLGAGGLTLARYVAATRPGSRQLAVDSDAALIGLVRRKLPLDQPSKRSAGPGRAPGRIRVRVADGRAVLSQLREGEFDLVVVDVFDAGQTPAHLTSAEFISAAARPLDGSGILAVNVADGPPLAHARARVATVRSLFPHVCMLADPGVLRGRRFGNLVVAASRRDLPVADLVRRAAADPFPARVTGGDEIGRFASGAAPISDATARPSPAPPDELFEGRGRR
jgi:spermidine synthase